MPVAKSFQKYNIVGEPYIQNKKQYVNIKYPDNHLRSVRWYTELEYAKLYPEDVNPSRPAYGPSKNVLGFSKGFITIFQEPISEDDEEWLRMSSARYHKIWKWYFISDEEIPQLPCGLRPRELRWELVGDEAGYPYEEGKIKKAIEELLYEESPSQFQGTVGDRIDRTLTVTRVILIDNGRYGPSNFYLFTDGTNVYSWQTAARQLEVGQTYNIRGTVREHRFYKREQQTVLTRCQVQ